MSIDNLNKRASCIGFDYNWYHVFPKPGTTKNINYRQQIGMKYAGTLTSSTATGGSLSTYRALTGFGV